MEAGAQEDFTVEDDNYLHTLCKSFGTNVYVLEVEDFKFSFDAN
jgi:hypothetical protein